MGKPKYHTKSWKSKPIPCEFGLDDDSKLKDTYNIPKFLQI